MWQNKQKAVTFSYDDGHNSDKRLVEMLDRHGLKCTFNINSALMGNGRDEFWTGRYELRRLNADEARQVYTGHEVAVHGATHPFLERLSADEAFAELSADKLKLAEIFGTEIKGMAYPFGTYDDGVVEMVAKSGLMYARTIESSKNFELQSDLLRFKPTCHHDDPELFDLAQRFLDSTPDKPMLFYIWGHTFEFCTDDDPNIHWERMERFCKMISGHDDVFYGTNSEVLL